MASIRERVDSSGKSKWHAQIRLLGHPTQTRTFDRKTDAKSWAEETERQMKAGRFQIINESQHRTVSELFAVFRNNYMRSTRKKDYTQILSWWEQRLGRLFLANVKALTIQKMLDELLREPLTFAHKQSEVGQPEIATVLDSDDDAAATTSGQSARFRTAGTATRYLAVLSRVMSVAVKNLEWLERSPIAGVKRPSDEQKQVVRTLSPTEENALLLTASESDSKYLGTIVMIALRSGMRYSEIMNLRWGDLELNVEDRSALATLRKTKNKRPRVVPIVSDAFDAVMTLHEGAGNPGPGILLFPSADNLKKPVEIRKAWATCLRRAKVPSFRFHDLRHSAASRFASLGYSLSEIAEILGHADHRSTQIYTHFAKGHTVKMARHAAEVALAGPQPRR